MRKRLYVIVMFVLVLFVLTSCKPSDKYTGDWYAVSESGEEVMINFSKDKVLTFEDKNENKEVHDIDQTVSGVQNSTRYFKVEIEGASHYVIFENRKDEDNAIFVKQTNQASDFEDVVGDIIYQMNRNDFLDE